MTHAEWVRGAAFDKDGARVLTWSEGRHGAGVGGGHRQGAERADDACGRRSRGRDLRQGRYAGADLELEDGTARVWEAATGKALSEPMTHAKEVRGAAFDKDGARVLTWSGDGTARVWEAATGKALSEPIAAKGSAARQRRGAMSGAAVAHKGTVRAESRLRRLGADERRHGAGVGGGHGQGAERADDACGSGLGRGLRQGRCPGADLERGRHGAGVGGGHRQGAERADDGMRKRSGARPSTKTVPRVLTWSEDGTARVWGLGVRRRLPPGAASNESSSRVWNAAYADWGYRGAGCERVE